MFREETPWEPASRVQPRDSESLRSLIDLVQPQVLVEFGSWEGRSALAFLQRAKERNLRTEVICVDTWLGSPEHWRDDFPDSEWSFSHLKLVNGEPRVLDTFREAMRQHHADEQVSIVRATTSLATIYLSRIGKKADLVYVDADHGFQAVWSDLRLAKRILREGGVIAGDDFVWSSVRLGVIRFAASGWKILQSEDLVTYALVERNRAELVQVFQSAGWQQVPPLRIALKEMPVLVRLLRKALKGTVDRVYLGTGLSRLRRSHRRYRR